MQQKPPEVTPKAEMRNAPRGAPQLTSAQGLGATSENAIAGTPTNTIPQNGDAVNSAPQNILHLNEDKKRTDTWFQALGRSTPFGGTKYGPIRIIPRTDRIVNTAGYNDAVALFGRTYRWAETGYDERLINRNYTSEIPIKAESPARGTVYTGTPGTEPKAELPTNRISQNSEKSTPNAKKYVCPCKCI